MAKPPKTPPQDPPHDPAPKSEELKREEADPAEALEEMSEGEKGMPKDSDTSWN